MSSKLQSDVCYLYRGWCHLENAYGVKAGWLLPLVNKRTHGWQICLIPLARAILSAFALGLCDIIKRYTYLQLYLTTCLVQY